MTHLLAHASRWLFWFAMAATLLLSLLPPSGIPPALTFWDKAQHALGFVVLAWLALASGMRTQRVLVGLLLWGAVIELLQSLTSWRQGDVWDWVADAVGVLMGCLLYRLRPLGPTMRP